VPFTFTELAVPGIVLVESAAFGDDRGRFFEGFKASEFAAAGLPSDFTQDNQSSSIPGVLRGLHFQRQPHAQGKLVSVTSGSVFDVGVDLRVGSVSFGKWVGVELHANDGRSLYIPPGFGHGFCVLGDEVAVVRYKCTNEYSHPHDGGVRWDDPEIGVEWPVMGDPILSAKDLALPSLRDCDHGFTF
jgi:dTDP-4-dehydrorhamnose 3,5-epimerase